MVCTAVFNHTTMTRIISFFTAGFALLLYSCGPEFTNEGHLPEHRKNESTLSSPEGPDLNHLIDSLKLNRNKIHVEVKKSAYTMKVYYDTTWLKTYPVVFGFNPLDDKLKQGDGCTPEGKFAIRTRYPHAQWSKFIWIDYPNADSWKKHNQAKREGKIPKNVSIGGEVGIHGVPKGYDFIIEERENWTLGCISLRTADINELYRALGEKSYVIVTR